MNRSNRWVILFSGVFCNFCVGAIYAWSVFQKPLLDMFGWQLSDISLAFTLQIVMIPLAMIVAGKLQLYYKPRFIMLVGGSMVGVGYIMTGFVDSLTWLYLGYGVLAGIGGGTIGSCVMTNSMHWFPDKKGVIGGLITSGMGLGAVVWGPVGNWLVQSVGVLGAFKALGIFYLLVVAAASMIIEKPPLGFNPPSTGRNISSKAISSRGDKDWRQMLRDPMFYILWSVYFIAMTCGLMLIAHAAQMAQEMAGASALAAAMIVGMMSISNTFGRISMGMLSDIVGRWIVLIIIFACIAAGMFVLANSATTVMFSVMMCLLILCYGGVIGNYPALVSELFGLKHLGLNYAILVTGYSVAGFIGPRFTALIREADGDYSRAFIIGAALGAVGFVLSVAGQLKTRNNK